MDGLVILACDTDCTPGSVPLVALALLLLGAVLAAVLLLFLQQDSRGAARVVLLVPVLLIGIGVPRALLTLNQQVYAADAGGIVDCGKAWTAARSGDAPGGTLGESEGGCARLGHEAVDRAMGEGAILGTLAVVTAGAGLVLRRRAHRA